ncbi:MAG: Uma2 family endonuclease [Hyphomonadaceae bacterium]|nr:Uma2 family endonuclease [Hyphomonadaceae bacterium]
MNAPVRNEARFDRAQFEKMARAGVFGRDRVELRQGKIALMSPQFLPHGRVKLRLATSLEYMLAAHSLGWEVLSETSVDAAQDFQPIPDIVVFDSALVPEHLDGAIPLAAVKLVVEVADATLADDIGEKLLEYARAGVAEYWVADVKGRLILRHAGPSETGFARREPVLFGQPAHWLTQDLSVETGRL